MRLPEQEAIIELRRRLSLTQQQLAVELGKAVSTVARWETSRIPSARELAAIAEFCRANGVDDLAAVFRRAALRRIGIEGES